MKARLFTILTLAILVAALFIRLYKLDSFPPSLNWDEISIGYNAYSILKTGQDEWGYTLPLNFRAYGDYKLPVYIYADIPFVAIFGLNEWGVRLLSSLAGFGTVLLIGLICYQLTEKRGIALLGLLLASFTPWMIVLSRIALEANLALFLTTASYYFFLRGLKNSKWLVLTALGLGLSFFTYNSSRVVEIPLVLGLLFFYRSQLRRINIWSLVALFILVGCFAVAIPLAVQQDSSARFYWTTLLDQGALNHINELRGSSALPPLADKLVNNKITYIIPEIAGNYLSHFNPDFLFITGGSNYQFSIPGVGLFSWAILPLFLLGLWQIKTQKKTWQLFLVWWFLISPLPAAITRDAPHALRSLYLLPPILLISCLGGEWIWQMVPKLRSYLLGLLIVLVFLTLGVFLQNYTTTYSTKYSWSWQYGYKQAVEYLLTHQSEYKNIYISKKYGEPHEFVLFYSQYDPAKYRNDSSLVRYQRSNWYWVDHFNNYTFVNDWEVQDKTKNQKGSLLITSPGNYPPSSVKLQTIYFLDNTPAFDIVKI